MCLLAYWPVLVDVGSTRSTVCICCNWNFCFPTDICSAGVWLLLSNLEDPELQRLAAGLPAIVLSSRANRTTRKYLGAFQRWKRWADARQGVPGFPVQETHLALYLTHLSESTGSKAAIEEALHALVWMHRVASLPPVEGLSLVQETAQGLRRLLAKPKKRKEPITAEMLKLMVESVGLLSLTPSLTEVRLLAVCLLAFAGDELIKLHCKDIVFNDEGMVVKQDRPVEGRC